jgi:hypothetical protein
LKVIHLFESLLYEPSIRRKSLLHRVVVGLQEAVGLPEAVERPTVVEGHPTVVEGHPTVVEGRPTVAVERPTGAVERPTAEKITQGTLILKQMQNPKPWILQLGTN